MQKPLIRYSLVLGQPYRISFDGRYGFDYAADVAKTLVECTRVDFQGADVFNLGADTVSSQEVIAAIEAVIPGMRGKLTCDTASLPFPAEVDNSALRQLLGSIPHTPLAAGVKETIELYQDALSRGQLTAPAAEQLLA